ncbi:MAG: polysaccharide deacetylase [Clostridiales bacterium]|nr:polysaccharide deacetylase [Clostridiales bacterium]
MNKRSSKGKSEKVVVILLITLCSLWFLFNRYSVFKEKEAIKLMSPYVVIPTNDEGKVGKSKLRYMLLKDINEVFLTFDDGPTENTVKILEILNKYKVKASFFVIGDLAERNKDIIVKLKDSGMCILPHSYSHDYNIYKSKGKYFSDLEKCIKVIEEITGRDIPPYTRMPGGSDNTIGKESVLEDIRQTLKKKNMRYVDWNVSSLDAVSVFVPKSTIRESVIRKCENCNFAVVLMHDSSTKQTTVESLEDIIKYLKENNFIFRTFDDITEREEKEMIERRIIYK